MPDVDFNKALLRSRIPQERVNGLINVLENMDRSIDIRNAVTARKTLGGVMPDKSKNANSGGVELHHDKHGLVAMVEFAKTGKPIVHVRIDKHALGEKIARRIQTAAGYWFKPSIRFHERVPQTKLHFDTRASEMAKARLPRR